MKKCGLELKQKSKELMVKIIFYEKDYSRIKVDTNDDLPLNETLKFPLLTKIFRAVFQEGKKFKFIYMSVCVSYKNADLRKN